MKARMQHAAPKCVSLVALITATLIAPSLAERTFRAGPKSLQTHKVSPEKELVILLPTVVDSDEARYPDRLSFGYLMEQSLGKRHRHEEIQDSVRETRGKSALIPALNTK